SSHVCSSDRGLEPEALLADPVRAVRPADTPGTPMPVPDTENNLTRPIPLPDEPTGTPENGSGGKESTKPIPLLARVFQRRTRPIPSLPPAAPAQPPAPVPRAVILGAENKIRQVAANIGTNATQISPANSAIDTGDGGDPS